MKRLPTLLSVLMILVWNTLPAHAHMLWLNLNSYHPQIGETVWIEIGWGHKYPRDQVIGEGWLEDVLVLTPNGKQLSAENIFPAFYRFIPEKSGTYQVVAKLKPAFVSITEQPSP